MEFKDSKHSYERLNFTNTLYRPVVKFALEDLYGEDIILDDSKKVNSDCNLLKEDSEIIISGRSKPWSTTPPCNDKLLRYYYAKMNKWYKKYSINDIRFITLTCPPTQIIKIHNKNKQYGTCKIDDQLRYLRNKIYEYLNCCKITKYIIVFEVTKKMIIHSHMLVIDEGSCESYKDLAHIMGYDTYKKMTVNIVEKACDENIIKYLLKIE